MIKIVFGLVIALNLLACTSGKNEDGAVIFPSQSTKQLSIEKISGINMGESTAIWGAGMFPQSSTNPPQQNVKINYLSLDSLKNYPRSVWDWSVPANVIGTKGIRTFISEWGMLMGKSGGYDTGLFLADFNSKSVTKIFDTSMPGYLQSTNGSNRGAPLSYKIGNNVYIAMLYTKSTTEFRMERFLRDESAPTKFVRLRPYEFPNTKGILADSIYSSFLDACSTQARTGTGACAPRLYITCYGCRNPNIQGIDLTADSNPPTLYAMNSTPITPADVVASNTGFLSTSHPPGGTYNLMNLGSINDFVYSMAGDPVEGYIFRSNINAGGSYSHVAYDKINGVVYRIDQSNSLMADGTSAGGNAGPVVTAFKKECFVSRANCDPTVSGSAAGSKIFRDVGSQALGASSDLGDGCVAMLSFSRPGDPVNVLSNPGVYKTCLREANDLSKGITSMKIGQFEGALYMYNDFTAATLYEIPIELEYDFAAEGFPTVTSVNFSWQPRSGFSASQILDLKMEYRCFNKGTTPPAIYTTWALAAIGPGYRSVKIPNCVSNVVQFKITKAGPHLTRFSSLKVTAYQQ